MKEITVDPVRSRLPDEAAPVYTIGEAWRDVLNDPWRIVRQWNYKGAIFSGVLRAPNFFITYLAGGANLRLALLAASVQFVFRFLFGGAAGTLIQSFRRVEPAWKALVSILLVVPVISHLLEFVVQMIFGNLTQSGEHTDDAVIRSICISIMSALFTLFLMRRNVMIVSDAESKSLLSDSLNLPIMLFHFLAFVPLEIARMIFRASWLRVVLSFAAFALFSQLLGMALTKKIYWTYGGGREIAWLKFWGADGTVLMVAAVCLALLGVYLHRRKHNEL